MPSTKVKNNRFRIKEPFGKRVQGAVLFGLLTHTIFPSAEARSAYISIDLVTILVIECSLLACYCLLVCIFSLIVLELVLGHYERDWLDFTTNGYSRFFYPSSSYFHQSIYVLCELFNMNTLESDLEA